MNELLRLRADVAVLLQAAGWRDSDEDGFLRCNQALFAVSNTAGDSSADGPGGYTLAFGCDVPAPVIAAACHMMTGLPSPPVLPDRVHALSEALTAALAERLDEDDEDDKDGDYDNAVLDVVGAIAALAAPPELPARRAALIASRDHEAHAAVTGGAW